jgi:ribokinase
LLKTLVIGAVNWDINLFVKRFPQPGEEVVVTRITRVPGGKAGNVAVAAARLLGPNQAAIIGGLGKDSIASEQVKIFEEEGVVVSGLKFNENVESGQAYIVIDEEGENIIHTHFGANATITAEDLDTAERRRLVSEAAVITIMDPPFETGLKLAKEAKRLGKTVAWDPGIKSTLGIESVRNLIENTDYVVANQSEIENLTGTKDPEQGAAKLMRLNARLKVVTKLGAKGVQMYHENKKTVVGALDLNSHGMRAVNTVGCGDAFLGAFVAALSEGHTDQESLGWANCAGGIKATRPETRGSPNRTDLLKHLDSVS